MNINVEFISNLIVFGEPQLVLFRKKKTNYLAVAVDPQDSPNVDFVCISVKVNDWEKYLNGHVDLHYLFTYPFNRKRFTLRYTDWNNDKAKLKPYDEAFSDDLLPGKGIFARHHTEDFNTNNLKRSVNQLFIDGDWELNEFGKFYQKYSDVYSFVSIAKNYNNPNVKPAYKDKAAKAFLKRPYKGGSSYLHVFDEMPSCLPPEQRLGLRGINYNSPGDVRILGQEAMLAQVTILIDNFENNRAEIRIAHDELKNLLKTTKLLTAPVDTFSGDGTIGNQIKQKSNILFDILKIPEQKSVFSLCGENQLVFAKITLALYRRIEATALFFAEGRMAFNKTAP